MSAPIRPRTRLTPNQYKAARAEGYSDEEIGQEYDLPESGGFGDGLKNVGNEMLQGASFGLADEAVGLVSPSLGSGMRDRSKQFNADHPWMAGAAQIGGGLLTGSAAAKGLGLVAKKALPAALARIATSLPGEAAIMSGTAAAGAADDNRIGAFGAGALGGAIVGPVVASGAGRIAASKTGQRVADLVSRATAKMRGQPVAAAVTPTEPIVTRTIERALKRSGKQADDVTSALQRPAARRAELALMDELPTLTESVATLPGQGAEDLTSSLAARARGRTTREVAALDETLGTVGQAPMPKAATIKAARKAASDPLYEQARGFAPTSDARVEALLEADDMQKALDAGARRVRSRNAAAKARGEPPIPTPASGYSVAQLDYAKRHLDGQISAARKAGDASRVDELTDLKNTLVGVIDDATKGANGESVYAAARQAFAKPSQELDAMKLGQKALTMREDELRATVQAMSPQQRETFRIGLADAARSKPEWVRQIMSERPNAGARETTLAAAFDDPAQFQAFKDALAAEAQGGNTKYLAAGNSRTAMRGASQADMNLNVAADAKELARGGVRGWLASKADAVAQRSQSAYLERNRDKIAAALKLRPGTKEYDDLITTLARQSTARLSGRRAARAALPAVGSSGKRLD